MYSRLFSNYDRSSSECSSFVVLLPLPHLPVTLSVFHFPVQLAHFRRRKTKGESSKTQKKTQKRKGEVVHTNDVPAEEDSLVTAKDTENATESGAEHIPAETSLECDSLAVSDCLDRMSYLEDRPEMKQYNPDTYAEEISELQIQPEDELSSQPLQQELQTAVHHQYDITHLSNNLQQALLSRQGMEEQAFSLSDQIRAVQRQLYDASESLKNKSPGKAKLYKAQQQFAAIQTNLLEQTVRMGELEKRAHELERELETSLKSTKEKENQMAKLEHLIQEQQKSVEILQKKLESSESSVSQMQEKLSGRDVDVLELKSNMSAFIQIGASNFAESKRGDGEPRLCSTGEDSIESLSALVIKLKEKLADSEALRETLTLKIEDQMKAFESERSSLEERHNNLIVCLNLKLQQAEETADKGKLENDRLNQEFRNLKDNLRLEAESCNTLTLQHERSMQMYIPKLLSMKEDKTKMDQKILDTQKEDLANDHLLSSEDQQGNLPQNDSGVGSFKRELEDLKKSLSRVKAMKEQENSEAAPFNKEENDDHSHDNGMSPMDKYLVPSCTSHLSELSGCHEDFSEHSRFELDSDFILEQSLNSTVEGNFNILSSPMPITGVLAGGASLGTLLDPESFAMYLSNSMLNSGEKSEVNPMFVEKVVQQCSILMEQLQDKERQLQKCSDSLEEALGKWREVTAELSATRIELEKEKMINTGDWNEEQRGSKDLKNERDHLKKQLADLEHFLKETHVQKSANEEHLSQLVEEKTTLENRLSLLERELEKSIELGKGLQVSNLQLIHNLQDVEKARESERQEFDNKLNSKGLEQQLLQETIKAKEVEFSERVEKLCEELHLVKRVKEDLERRLQEEVQHLNSEFLKSMEVSGESWKEQIKSLKQEHEKEMSLLKDSHDMIHHEMQLDLNVEKQRLHDEIQRELEEVHRLNTEQTLQQLQLSHNVELEALRLSLTNMHTAHLELSQSNLTKEKESALIQLRETLNDKRAQDVALLQGRHQFETERLHDQHSQALKNLQDELSQAILNQRQEHMKEVERLKEESSVKTFELHERFRQELEELHEQEREKYKTQQEANYQEMKQLREDFAQESSQQLQKHSEELRVIEEQCAEKVLQLQELHIKEKTEMQAIHAQEKQLWQMQQEELSQEVKQLNEEELMEILQDKELKSKELLQLTFLQGMSKLQDQHKKEIENLHELHANERLLFENQKTEYEELQKLQLKEQQEWTTQYDQHSKEIAQLQERKKETETAHNLHTQEKDEWEKHREQQSALIKQLEEKILQVQEEHLKIVVQLQDQHHKEMKELEEQHILENEEWERKRDQHSHELDLLVNQHSQELKRIGEELLQDSLQKQEENARMIEHVRDECSKEILYLKDHHCREVRKIQEIAQWERQSEQQLKQTQEHILSQQANPDRDYNLLHVECLEKVRSLQEQHKQELAMLDERHAQEKLEWEKMQDYHTQQLNHLENQHSEKLKLCQEEHSKQIEEMLELKECHREEIEYIKLHKKKIIHTSQKDTAAEGELGCGDHIQETSLLAWKQSPTEDIGQKMQYQISNLQFGDTNLKLQSRQEIPLLWSHIDRSRASRQELNELKEQLIARSTQLQEMESMKEEFEQQKIQLKAEHEKELEELRIYFEQKSMSAEETYREELEILHQRLREMSNEEISLNSSTLAFEESFESEKIDDLQNLTDQLEHRKYKEDLLNMKMDLSDKYIAEIEILKKKHCLELEQLRAKLSEEHIREITKLQLETSKKVASSKDELLKGDDVDIMELPDFGQPVYLKDVNKINADKVCQMEPQDHSEVEEQRDDRMEGLQIHRLKQVQDIENVRTVSLIVENTGLQKNLLGELQISGVSEDYEEVVNDAVSNLQPQEEEVCISEKHKQEPGSHSLQTHAETNEELTAPLSIFYCHSDDHPDLCSSELRRYQLLLQKHPEELLARELEHEANIQSLEASHLLKLDTLESSYLTEIQKIRDEHTLAVEELGICLSDRLQEKEKEIQDRLAKAKKQWLEQHEQELQQLRQELASVHLGKFQAMAGELETAHREDLKLKLEQQRSQLEEDKHLAFDSLQEAVLRMEHQNQLALQELHDLHRLEVEQQSHEQNQKLKQELQKQEVLITELKSQCQALSAELQSKSDQQSQFLEEVELLKCQSEMLLEQQITQLKDELNLERKAKLQEVEDDFSRKLQAELKVNDCLNQDLEVKTMLVLQLQEKVSVLTKETNESQSQMEKLVKKREQENQDGGHLISMLQSDKQTVQQEQTKLQDSCQRLLKIFTDVLKCTLVTEDLICKKIGVCLDNSMAQADDRSIDTLTSSSGEKQHMNLPFEALTEQSLMSSDEGYELSEYLCESMLGSMDVCLENEDKIVWMSHRLRTAVERILDMVSESAVQLEQTREMQKCFEEQFKKTNLEMAQMLAQNQDLQKQLAQETEAKNQLHVELHKAQGLIEGYAAEKITLEKALSTKESSEHQLVVELEKAREQLNFRTEEPPVSEEKEVLLKLQEVLSGNVGDIEAELLKETAHLVKEKLELHCQANKDRSNLLSQMRVLEMELEEQMSRNQELLKKTNQVTDLQQQIQSLEKQLKSQRHFMDEQAVEREHERDDFQQEIRNLEEQLKQALKNHGDPRTYGICDWSVQIETLEARVKEKARDCNLLLQGKDHLEQEIAERNEEIDKMLLRIQELEQAALSNADAAKKCSQLEAELQKMLRLERELVEDKEALQQQQFNNVLQISALQSKLDEARHRIPVEGEPDNLLKEELQAEREALQRKEKEAESLAEQLELFREQLMNKTEEVLQLDMQLEIQRKQNDLAVQQAQEDYLRIKDEISTLKQERAQNRPSSSLELPQALLQEKNQEIDHLNEQLLRLQQEVSELDEMRSLVEHLRSDQDRLRKDKEEEVEQLHEVIEKLQQELEQLGPIRHEVSDSQESLEQLGLEVENLQAELRKGEQQLCEESSEKEKLSEAESSYKGDLETLQQQLEKKEALHITEVEVLKRNLHNLQQSNRRQEQALDSLLLQHNSLFEDSDVLRAHLSQKEKEFDTLSVQLQEMQDMQRETKATLLEKELLIQTLQEESAGDVCELRNQLQQTIQSLEAANMDLEQAQQQNVSFQNILSNSSNEQRVKDEKYNEEREELKEQINEWKDKAQALSEEVQRLQKTHKNEQEMTESETSLVLDDLKEQLRAAETLAKVREAELDTSKSQVTNLQCQLEELHAECEHRDAETQQVLQQLKKRDACVAGLQSHSQNLGTQVKRLQETLASQESMMSCISRDLYSQNLEERKNKPTGISRPSVKPLSYTESLIDLSTLDSPEMVRKQEPVHSLRGFTSFSELSMDHSAELDVRSKLSDHIEHPEQCDLIGSSTPSLSGSNYSLQHTNTQTGSPLRESGHITTDYDSCEDKKDSRDDQIGSERSDEIDYRSECDDNLGLKMSDAFYIKEKIDSMTSRGLSAQLQRMLNMVHEESCKVLELSEGPFVKASSSESSEALIQLDAWQKEKQNLQETIQSLSSALAQAAGKEEKEITSLDWKPELLQSVQALLESEREYLRLELKSHLHHGAGHKSTLSDKMEHLIKEQEAQKHLVLEHVFALDRSSLLSEIQDLRSQLRMAHLQNQEKLQQLQDTLTSTEEKGNTKEHQLRRQVELLEYKLQQESAIAEDLKEYLSREKERASEYHRQLLQEQATISHLRSEQEEKELEIEKLKKSQKELKLEISKLRDELGRKEEDINACMETMRTQLKEEKQRLEEEKVLTQQALSVKEKYIQEVSLSVEEQRMLNAKISAALSQEQTSSSNLRKELDIEQSRCRALLTQEQHKLIVVEQELKKEKQHSLSLSNTLALEHGMLEKHKEQHTQELLKKEEERQQDQQLLLIVQNELEEERNRARDLVAMLDKIKHQDAQIKQQLECDVKVCREEAQNEREVAIKLRVVLESLQFQKEQLHTTLEQHKEREICLQKERDQFQAQLMILQEGERVRTKEYEKETSRSKQMEASKARQEEQERQIMHLQLQHDQDMRRIKELQNTLADLEEQERALCLRRSQLWGDSSSPHKNIAGNGSSVTDLQRVWKQLLHIMLQVKKWAQNRSDRVYEGFPDEAEVTVLLESLAELKSKLQREYTQLPAQATSSVLEVLKRENEELKTSVSQLTKEKLDLRNEAAKLRSRLQDLSQKEAKQLHSDALDSVLEAERAVWHREKRHLQLALKHAESELSKATLENRPFSEVPNSKMQRLYKRYLRAESFRKALVYQKKYLLLLLGGFQACEKATLSLIARMGVYPSPADIHAPCKSGLPKFRSAVRAVIAISRLKFLVRKWQKGNKKVDVGEPLAAQVHVSRTDVLQQLGGTLLNSPPTRDVPFNLHNSPTTIAACASRTSYLSSKRSSHSPALIPQRSLSSRDPEHSLTEYIHHLELVQRRLGGLQDGHSPELPQVKGARK